MYLADEFLLLPIKVDIFCIGFQSVPSSTVRILFDQSRTKLGHILIMTYIMSTVILHFPMIRQGQLLAEVRARSTD